MFKKKLHVCTGRWCRELGSERILDTVKAWFTVHKPKTEVTSCKCLGYCEQGVNAMKRGKVYHELTEENAIEVLTTTEGKQRGEVAVELEDDFLGDL